MGTRDGEEHKEERSKIGSEEYNNCGMEKNMREETVKGMNARDRLRDLKQLGLVNMVYPGAVHSRFEHSLGVYMLAGEAVHKLQIHQGSELGIDRFDIQTVKLAGLLHDVGHGPFSHLFEREFLPQVLNDSKWSHEQMSEKMIDHIVEQHNIDIDTEIVNRVKTALWKYLKRCYQQANHAHLYQIEYELSKLEQGTMSIQEFYSKLTSLWNEVQLMDPEIPTTAVEIVNKLRDRSRLMQFLYKLRADFERTRAAIMNRPTLPSLESALADLLAEETRQSTLAFMKDASSPVLSESALVAGNFRGKHRDVTKGPHHGNRALIAAPGQQNGLDSSSVVSSSSVQPSLLTPEQLQQIVQAMASSGMSGTSNTSSQWYIDSGASNHMTGNSSFLENFVPYKGDGSISTADGNHLSISHEMILASSKNAPPKSMKEKHFLYDIVANGRNGIDVDKFDYIVRDCRACGLGCNFQFERLMDTMRVMGDEICYRAKDYLTVHKLFATRADLHRTVYTHEKVKAIELMFVDALLKANDCLQISSHIHEAAEYWKLDDTILKTIVTTPNQELRESRDLILRIHRRDLYQFCNEYAVPKDKLEYFKDITPKDIVCSQTTSGVVLREEDVAVSNVRIDLTRGRHNPLERATFSFLENGSLLAQCRFLQLGFCQDYESEEKFLIPDDCISHLLPACYQDRIVRVYSKRPELVGAISDAFKNFQLKTYNQSTST
ncbi:hypothetical protein HHK36_029637 [Tetracentron sinense]|uniref:HD/PDEase domain-containing protein n=1 Tax=Tetracentron sinense TaxID=13715 RepID=A0A835D2S9_TETSI|nr:hypothetical protein HHK36_029637 [Tetracentron sinense]